MRYVHYYAQKASVPQDRWDAFKAKFIAAFRQRPEMSSSAGGYFRDRPLIVCTGTGQKAADKGEDLFLEGQGDDFTGGALWVNGSKLLSSEAETFILPQVHDPEHQEWERCDTERKPYDWFVVAALILIHHEAPGCYEISSDGNKADWEPVIRWLAPVVGHELCLPPAIDGFGEPFYPTGQGLNDLLGEALSDVPAAQARPVADPWENRLVGLPSFYF